MCDIPGAACTDAVTGNAACATAFAAFAADSTNVDLWNAFRASDVTGATFADCLEAQGDDDAGDDEDGPCPFDASRPSGHAVYGACLADEPCTALVATLPEDKSDQAAVDATGW